MSLHTLQLSPEDIEALVKQSVMRSGFGAAVEKAMTTIITGYNNPIETELKRYAGQVARELIEQHFAAKIRAVVAEQIAKQVTDTMIDTTVGAAVKKMTEAAERY